MNNHKRVTLIDRIRNAIKAFKGQPIGALYFGVDVKRCDQCEYKNERPLRDDLLINAGARAAYMEDQGCIELPSGVDGEAKLAKFVSSMVDHYLNRIPDDLNCDEYIENALIKEYEAKKIELDERTKEYFKYHDSMGTTVAQCEKCGLWYKPRLGHYCKAKGE